MALGLAVYLYLPLRAAAGPLVNWGDPQTPGQFWWVITGGPYRQYLFSLPLEHLPGRLLAWTSQLTQQFAWPGLMAAALGAAALWTANRALFVATGTTVALGSIFAIGYNTSDSYLYLLPALVCLGLWLGAGVNWLVSALARQTQQSVRAATMLAIALPLVAGAHRFPTLNLSDDRAVYDFEAAILDQAPAEAIVLSERDCHTFALWYFQLALGQRPDIVVADIDLLEYSWYDAQLSSQLGLPASVGALLAGKDETLQQASEILNRPVCRIAWEGTGLNCTEP